MAIGLKFAFCSAVKQLNCLHVIGKAGNRQEIPMMTSGNVVRTHPNITSGVVSPINTTDVALVASGSNKNSPDARPQYRHALRRKDLIVPKLNRSAQQLRGGN